MLYRSLYPTLEALPLTEATTQLDIQDFLAQQDIGLSYIYCGERIVIIHPSYIYNKGDCLDHPDSETPLILSRGMVLCVTEGKHLIGVSADLLKTFFTTTVTDDHE